MNNTNPEPTKVTNIVDRLIHEIWFHAQDLNASIDQLGWIDSEEGWIELERIVNSIHDSSNIAKDRTFVILDIENFNGYISSIQLYKPVNSIDTIWKIVTRNK